MKKLIRLLLLALFAILLQACATTVITADCDNPKISNDSLPFVYLVMLPYTYKAVSIPSQEYQSAVASLNEAASLQIVKMGAETSEMHVTILKDTGKGCSIDGVYKSFTAKKFFSRELLSPVVFYWGEIFEVNDQMIVQSHVRMLWKDPEKSLINIEVNSGRGEAKLNFTGTLPYATLSFPQRSIPIDTASKGGGYFQEVLEARKNPNYDSERTDFPKKFSIGKRIDNWVELRDPLGQSAAWVDVSSSAVNAKSLLPELIFAHALAAYASYSNVPVSDTAKNSIDWLADFKNAYGSQDSDTLYQPKGVASLIEAVVRMRRSNGTNDDEEIRKLMDEAVKALPTNAMVLNLVAMSKIGKCCLKREDAVEIQSLLELARHLDAGNEIIARNLLNWYGFLEGQNSSVWPSSKDETRRRASDVENALPQ